jgi:hypothetical protein
MNLPADGTYRVLATSFSEGEEGAYRLIATASPTEDLRCEWERGAPPLDSELSEIEILPGRALTHAELSAGSTSGLPAGRSALAGVEISGVLSSADHRLQGGGVAQGWSVEVLEGESYRIELASSAFDPYLIVDGPGFDEPLWSDDDGGELNSRLEFVAGESGALRVIVRAATGEGTGDFSLRVIRVLGGR